MHISTDNENTMVKKEKQGPNAKVIVDKLPTELINNLMEEWLYPKDSDASIIASPFLFKPSSDKIFHAMFMGQEKKVKALVEHDPELLFAPGTFRMQCINADGTPSTESEYIIHGTLFEISLFTGDFRMWRVFFPLIPDNLLERAIETMKSMHPSRGGSDVAKIDWDPRPFLNDKTRLIEMLKVKRLEGNSNLIITYDVLSNPDGIVSYFDGQQYLFFYVNQKANEIEGPLSANEIECIKNKDSFESFMRFIEEDLPKNSGARLSDEHHKLVENVFGKSLERNGLHYVLWDSSTNETRHYQDVCDGGLRLINGYLKFFEIYDAHEYETSWDLASKAWVSIPRHITMPHFNHLLCHKRKYPYNKNALKLSSLERCDNYYDEKSKSNASKHIYPVILDGCTLYFMSIATDVNTVELKKKLCLIKSGDKYHLWGYKDHTWQLTLIDPSQIPFRWLTEQWNYSKTEFISSQHEFFNVLKESVSINDFRVGFSVGLFKGVRKWAAGHNESLAGFWGGFSDFSAVTQTVEISKECFNEQLCELENRLSLLVGYKI